MSNENIRITEQHATIPDMTSSAEEHELRIRVTTSGEQSSIDLPSYDSSRINNQQNQSLEHEVRIELENTHENNPENTTSIDITEQPETNNISLIENSENESREYSENDSNLRARAIGDNTISQTQYSGNLQTESIVIDDNLQTRTNFEEDKFQTRSSFVENNLQTRLSDNEENLQTQSSLVEDDLQTGLPVDHQHSFHHVIEVEEFSSKTKNNESDKNSKMCHLQSADSGNKRLSQCNCNCHLEIENSQSTSITHSNNQSETINHVNVQSNSTTHQNNQSASSLPSCSQSNANIQSTSNLGVTTIEVTEMGLDNASFEFLRENSTSSTASSQSVKPPTYRSLGEFYLNDEPPKYEAITGKKLADELEETPQEAAPVIQMVSASSRLNCKSKVAGFFILMGICLITGLLVYLSITSENNVDPTGRS